MAFQLLEEANTPEPGAPGGAPALDPNDPYSKPPPERPWRPIVEGALKIVQRKCDGWDWDPDGTEMLSMGIEKQLTLWMPYGLIDLEKYPSLLAVAGLAILLVANTDDVVVNGKKKWVVRPLRKALPAPKQEPQGNEAVVNGDDLRTR
jgi:hypothetical protein